MRDHKLHRWLRLIRETSQSFVILMMNVIQNLQCLNPWQAWRALIAPLGVNHRCCQRHRRQRRSCPHPYAILRCTRVSSWRFGRPKEKKKEITTAATAVECIIKCIFTNPNVLGVLAGNLCREKLAARAFSKPP